METRENTDWGRVWLLFAIGLLAAAQFAKLSLGFTALAALYDQPAPLLALSLSGVSAAGIALGAVAGFGVARFGPRPVLLVAMALAGGLSLLQALGLPFWVFLATRLIEGMTHLGIVVAAPVLMVHLSARRDYPMVMALWAAYFGVSFALVALILPALIPAIGLTGAWGLHGAAIWGLAVLAFFLLPRVGQSAITWPGFLGFHRRLYSDPARLGPGLGFFWHTLIFMALITFLPAHVSATLPQGVIAGLLPLVALAGIFLAGILARRIPPVRLMQVSYGSTAAVFLVLALAPDPLRPYLALLSFLIIGVSPGAAFAAIPALNATPAAQAEANGGIAQLGNLGTGAGSPLFALAIGAAGFAGLVGMVIGICIIGVLALRWLERQLNVR